MTDATTEPMIDATTEPNFETLLAASEPPRPTRRTRRMGKSVRGEVVAMDNEQLLVDIGDKTEAVIERASIVDADGQPRSVAVGDSIEAVITGVDGSGRLVLGTRHGRLLHGQAELEQAYEQGSPVEGLITAAVKGGLEVQIAGQRGFCPASQVDTRFVEDLSTLVNQRCTFRITKLSTGRHLNLVVSRRAVLEMEQAEQAEQTRARLAVGAVFTGRVTSLRDFGAFIDLGGVEGLVHVSELAFGRVRHPSEVLTVGQEVEVAVLRIDTDATAKRPAKIALSLRALAQDPWRDAELDYPVGALVSGTVTRMESFGAFVALASGLEGMMHISALGAKQRIAHPDAVLTIGQTVTARVMAIEPPRRRLALALVTTPAEGEDASAAPATATPPKPTKRAPPAAAPEPTVGTFGALLRAQLNKTAN